MTVYFLSVILLVMAIDKEGDPVNKERDNYKGSDIVEVRDNDNPFTGSAENCAPATDPNCAFIIVNIPDIDAATIHALAQAAVVRSDRSGLDSTDLHDTENEVRPTRVSDILPVDAPPEEETPVQLQRRRFILDYDGLPQAAQNQAYETGVLTADWADLRDYIQDSRDGVPIYQAAAKNKGRETR